MDSGHVVGPTKPNQTNPKRITSKHNADTSTVATGYMVDDMASAYMAFNASWRMHRRGRAVDWCVCRHGHRCAYNNGTATIVPYHPGMGDAASFALLHFARPARKNANEPNRVVMGPPLPQNHPMLGSVDPDLRRRIEKSHRYCPKMHPAFAFAPIKKSGNHRKRRHSRLSPVASNLLRVTCVVGDCDGDAEQ